MPMKFGPSSAMPAATTRMSAFRFLRRIAVLACALPLAGCGTVLLNASGDVARQQGDLIVHSTLLMLLIIVPVLALIGIVAWRYRQSNRAATYTPEWDHSTQLELVIWMVPLLIIIALGAITWISTHTLDPYRPIERIDQNRPVASGVKPLVVEVVALDWKWLFIYPEQGIASVNELAAPVDRPIRFDITASSVMNSFYIPALAGQVYAMPGMQTQLHAVINKAGTYEGFSANYSGAGFSHMRFAFRGVDEAGFEQWVAQARTHAAPLDRPTYLQLEKPSENAPVAFYGTLDAGLFDAILNRCVAPGTTCINDMMMHDMHANDGAAHHHHASE